MTRRATRGWMGPATGAGPVALVALAASITLAAPSAARADWRQHLDFAQRVLLPDCLVGYTAACEELARATAHVGAHEPLPHVRWRFAGLAARVCEAGYDPACRLALRFGQELVVDPSPESAERGAELLVRVCERHPSACAVAREEAEDLLRGDPAAVGRGLRILEASCLQGDRESCHALQEQGAPSPHGATRRVLGSALAYGGLGMALLGAVGWAVAFADRRCRTRGSLDDTQDLYGACFVAMAGYVGGTALSVLGTKLRLDGDARALAHDSEVGGNSWFLWLGLGAGALGAAVPLGVELLERDWREVIAYAPLVLGGLSQILLFVARWLGPMEDDPYNRSVGLPSEAHAVRVAPVMLPVAAGDGRVGSIPGAMVRF